MQYNGAQLLLLLPVNKSQLPCSGIGVTGSLAISEQNYGGQVGN